MSSSLIELQNLYKRKMHRKVCLLFVFSEVHRKIVFSCAPIPLFIGIKFEVKLVCWFYPKICISMLSTEPKSVFFKTYSQSGSVKTEAALVYWFWQFYLIPSFTDTGLSTKNGTI